MGRKGVSPLIAFVLLIGFTVALGSVVIIWMKEQAQSSVDIIVEDVETDLSCGDVSFNAHFVPSAAGNCTEINITNKGVRRIKDVTVRYEIGTKENFNVEIMPGETKNLKISKDGDIDIIPVIVSGEKKIGCSSRKVSLIC